MHSKFASAYLAIVDLGLGHLILGGGAFPGSLTATFKGVGEARTRLVGKQSATHHCLVRFICESGNFWTTRSEFR